jgi:small conductance mechanosensitive channel
MALQGSLSNFAGGALILLFRPIKVGELIEAQGVIGHVKEIQMFTTQISTPHNKLAIVPNGALANGNIINFSRQGLIRADINISIANDQNIEKARKVILDTMQQHPKVLKSPQPTVNVSNIDGGAVKLDILPCCNPEDYWDVFYQLHEQFYNNLAAANIAGPIPHRVIINKA